MSLLLPGITQDRVTTSRTTTAFLHDGRQDGEPVLLVHGNVSSSLFFQGTLSNLPSGFRGIAPDLRGFGDSEPAPVDASRGVRDWSEDLAALVEALDLGPVHLLGWSMGGGVVLQLLLDHPELVRSVTLENPVSPFGFGGTRGLDGEVVAGGAGSGGGAANPDFVTRLRDGDTGEDSPFSPRNVLRAFYVTGAAVLPQEDVYVASMLSTRIGEDHYPGDVGTAQAWPGFGPGARGVLNTIAATRFDVSGITGLPTKPPVLWVRGAADQIVSDASLFDLAFLGQVGAVPGWPGEDDAPPQPMVAQTRAVLDAYAAAGGRYTEVVLETGHSPHVERPEEFDAALAQHLQSV